MTLLSVDYTGSFPNSSKPSMPLYEGLKKQK